MSTSVTASRGTVMGRDAFAASWPLYRMMVRRDRLRMLIWALATASFTASSVATLKDTYATEESRASIIATMENPAMVAMTGVNPAPDNYTFGAMTAHQLLVFSLIAIAIMSVMLTVRHTRAEESAGRAELVRAAAVGRHATSFAAFKAVATANLAVAAALTLFLGAQGVESIDWHGSLLYGAAHLATGLVFTAIALLTAQVSEYARGATGIGLAVVGLAYVVRAVGDVGESAVSWLSPLGWAQATQPYVANRWWPLALSLVTALVITAAAMALSTRRDVGAGLRAPRAAPSAASETLSNPVGFAWRSQRGMIIGWTVGIFVLGVSYGSVFGDIETFFADLEGFGDLIPGAEQGDLTAGFLALVATVTAVVASCSAILAAQRLRTEEASGRAEPLLVAGLSRSRWVAANVTVALAGGLIVMTAGGVGLGLAGGAALGDWSLAADAVVASLLYVPALWAVSGIGIAAFGLAPRLVPWVWAIIAYSFVAVYLRGLIGLPEWMEYFAPVGYVPRYPIETVSVVPLVGLTLLTGILVAAGIAGFRRRDVRSTT